MFALILSSRQASLSEYCSKPLLGLLLHLPSRTGSTSATIHPSHKNSHISHFQSHQNVQVTHRWLEEPNKWDTQVNKPESKQTSREELFTTFRAISLTLKLCILMAVITHTMWSHSLIREVVVVERHTGLAERDKKSGQSVGCPFISWCFIPWNWVTTVLICR